MGKNYFISFEGIDGSGKDTQLSILSNLIKEDSNGVFGDKYSNIWITREPTNITKAGIEMSKLLKGEEVDKETTTNLFISDRKEHTQMIKEMLKHSHVLISRYDLSTLSYQMTQGMDFDELYKLHEYEKDSGCIIPDLTIVFDLNPEIGLKRAKNRESEDEFFEVKEFQEKLRENLLWCVEELKKRDSRKIIVVNANQSIEEVTKEMIGKIKKEL